MSSSSLEEEDSVFFINVKNYSPRNMTSHPRSPVETSNLKLHAYLWFIY